MVQVHLEFKSFYGHGSNSSSLQGRQICFPQQLSVRAVKVLI